MSEGTIDDVLAGRATWALVHGDCRQVACSIGEDAVDALISDPPFLQSVSDNARAANTGAAGSHAFIDFAGIDGMEPEIMTLALSVARRWVVIFCALEQLGDYKRAAGDEWIRGSAWYRTNPAPQFTGDRPGQRYEGIAIAHRKGKKRWARGGECWAPSGPTINSIGEADRPDHPTPKPLWLMIECVDAFTNPDELVLDPFAGSGTTGVACLRLGRRFIGIEKSDRYAEVARERLRAEERGLSLREARAGQTTIFDALGVGK
jgi:site-specific DNA-methyltransferase (adenine-specific)